MELFDEHGEEPWRNILWMIGLSVVGVFLTMNYFESREREKREAEYVQATAYLTNAEEWVRVSKKKGREVGRKNFYKINYKYTVGMHTYKGNANMDDLPDRTIPVFYDSREPMTHVLKRHKSHDASTFLLVGGVLVLGFLGVNGYLFKSKRAKLAGLSSSGSFRS